MYLSWFLFFVAGILFSKIASTIFDLGIIVNVSIIICNRILLSLIMIEQEIVELREYKVAMLRERGFDEDQIKFHLTLFDNWFTKWREVVILNLLTNYPAPYRARLEFHNWETAKVYVEKLIKSKKF